MPVINILSPHVADMIAAGEVVERPASVIKELTENSFDAGAKNVTIEMRGGGATYIRVSDDGCGMAPEDAGVAFLRHATSKLHDERGLEAISTMGFRGEALAAISAVSRIELKTRRREDDAGTRVTLDGGDIQEMTPCGCPVGTSMTVRDIFYNTPARLKFLKSDRSEASACTATALRCALGRPEISVRFIRDGAEEFFSPGDGRADSAIYTLLGRELAATMLEAHGEDEGMRVSGFVSSPSAGRGNRSAQYFFCNGRYIRSALLQSAVEQAYKNTLLTGRYPACVLYLDLSCASVDVNVHPAKTEVKFSQERRVFDLVYHAALSALSAERRTAEPSLSPATQRLADAAQGRESVFARAAAPAPSAASSRVDESRRAAVPAEVAPREDFYRRMSAEEFRAANYSAAPQKDATAERGTQRVKAAFNGELTLRAQDEPYQTRLPLSGGEAGGFAPKFVEMAEISPDFTAQTVENSVKNVDNAPVPEYRIVGEALKTYIIVEVAGELILIDKHAAHERMIFDRLKAQKREIISQQLIAGVPVRVDGEGAELLEQNDALLRELGFELESYGKDSFIIRAVPAELDAGDAACAVEELIDRLKAQKTPDPDAARDEVLHTVACKAAIKAGWNTDVRELARVAESVLSGQVKYCPHGRPVSVTVTRRELDKLFKRIV